MAVKIVRQTNKIALLGAPTSAAAMSAGLEGAPTALRAAGLVERLKTIGYAVADLGDDPVQLYKPDEESPRARNLTRVIASLESLKPRVEQAVKSAALPLILAGDCSVALATVAGARRYFRKVSMIYMDRDADLNTPATTPPDAWMAWSFRTSQDAAPPSWCASGASRRWSANRIWRSSVLRASILPEEQLLANSPLRRYLASDVQRQGATAAAHAAIDRIRGNGYQFVLALRCGCDRRFFRHELSRLRRLVARAKSAKRCWFSRSNPNWPRSKSPPTIRRKIRTAAARN